MKRKTLRILLYLAVMLIIVSYVYSNTMCPGTGQYPCNSGGSTCADAQYDQEGNQVSPPNCVNCHTTDPMQVYADTCPDDFDFASGDLTSIPSYAALTETQWQQIPPERYSEILWTNIPETEWASIPASVIEHIPATEVDILQLNAEQKAKLTLEQLTHEDNLALIEDLSILEPVVAQAAIAAKFPQAANIDLTQAEGNINISADGVIENNGTKLDLANDVTGTPTIIALKGGGFKILGGGSIVLGSSGGSESSVTVGTGEVEIGADGRVTLRNGATYSARDGKVTIVADSEATISNSILTSGSQTIHLENDIVDLTSLTITTRTEGGFDIAGTGTVKNIIAEGDSVALTNSRFVYHDNSDIDLEANSEYKTSDGKVTVTAEAAVSISHTMDLTVGSNTINLESDLNVEEMKITVKSDNELRFSGTGEITNSNYLKDGTLILDESDASITDEGHVLLHNNTAYRTGDKKAVAKALEDDVRLYLENYDALTDKGQTPGIYITSDSLALVAVDAEGILTAHNGDLIYMKSNGFEVGDFLEGNANGDFYFNVEHGYALVEYPGNGVIIQDNKYYGCNDAVPDGVPSLTSQTTGTSYYNPYDGA